MTEKDIIILSVEFKKSTMYGWNPIATGRRPLLSEIYSMKKAVGGCGYDKINTAKADVLNNLLTQEELKSVENEYGVKLLKDGTYAINGACGTVDYIMEALGYKKFQTYEDEENMNSFAITYIKGF